MEREFAESVIFIKHLEMKCEKNFLISDETEDEEPGERGNSRVWFGR